MGQYCIEHYAVVHRAPVFSHAELLCRMAESTEPLSVDFLTVVTKQLKELLATERSLRRHVARLGVRRAERLVFENSEDDKRECDLCHTTLYLSALACKCSPSMVCLAHHQARTCCPHEEQIMRYRYGLDELSESIDKLEGQLEEYRRWKVDVERITQWSISFLPDNNPLSNSLQSSPTQDEADRGGLDEAGRIGAGRTDGISEDSAPSDEPKPPIVGCLVSDSREDVQSQSEEFQKPSMNQLSKLIEVGQARKYPPADIDPLLNLSLFIRECSELLHNILRTHGRAIEDGCVISKVDVTDSGCSSSSLVDDGSSDTDASMASDVESSESTIAPPHLSFVTDYSATVGKTSASPKPEAGRSPKKTALCAGRKRSSKLSLDEFYELIQVASKIRVFLPELDQLETLGAWITDWRSRASKVIQQCNAPALSDTEETDVPTVNAVKQLLDQAETIHMELPETVYLKRVYDCLAWKEQVETTLACSNKETSSNDETAPLNKPSLTDLCDLQFHGDLISATIAYVKTPDSMKLEDDTPDALPSPTFPDKSRLDVVLINTSRHLLGIIKSAKVIEDRLIAIQNSKSGSLSVDDVLSEIAEAETLPAQLPIIADIRSMCVRAKQLEVQFKQMERLLIAVPPGQPFPPVAISEDLYEKLRMGTVDCSAETWKACAQSLLDVEHPFPLNCPHFQHVTEMLNILVQFRDRLTRLFLWPQSKMHLLEVLLPRSVRSIEMLLELDNARSSDSSWSTYTKRGSRSASLNATTYWTLSKENARSFAEADVTCSNASQLYRSVYSAFIDSELNLMHHLRCSNAFKSKSKAQNSVTYCICRKTGFSGFMVQCELCRDWFHGRCVLPPNMKESETDRLRYMCPRCERSMRPDLTHVHALLDDLVRILPIEATTQPTPTSASTRRPFCLPRLPEFVALQMLCERAVSFVRRLRNVIQSTPELSQAVCKYEQFSGLKMPLFGFVEEDGQLTKLDEAVSSDTSQLLGHPIRTYQSATKATGSRDSQPRRLLSGLTRPARTTVDSNALAEESETPSSAGVMSPERCWKAASHKESAGNLTSEVAAMTAGYMASRSRTDSQGPVSQKTICSLQTQAERRMLMEGPSSLQKAGPRSNTLGDPTLVPRTYDRRSPSTSLVTPKVRPSATDQAKYFFCPLAPETRQILENLMMEASLLEVSIPQTRWLWQLHLASDPETPIGATRPYVARRDELRWKRRRFRHQRLIRPPFISARQERRKRPQPPADDTTLQSGEGSSNSADSECSATSSPATIREGKHMRTKDGVTSERSRSSSVSSLSADQSTKRSAKPRTFRRNLSSGISENQENPSSRLSQTVHRRLLNRVTRVGSAPSRSRLSMQVGGSSRYMYGSTTYRRRLPVTNKQPGKTSKESNPFSPSPRPNLKVQRNRPTHRSVTTQHSPNRGRPSVDVPEARTSSSHSVSHKSHAQKRRVAPFNSNNSSRRLKGRRIAEPGDVPKKRNASSADEDECAAAVCQNPRGGTVEWIACDSCERWFHQLCVGIRHKSQVPKEYACARCLQRYQARLARIRYKQRARLGRPHVTDRSSVEEHHTASMRMRQFPRRRSLLESCSIQRPIGWNSSSRPVGFTSSENAFHEGNVTSTNSAATAVEASSEGASMETDGVQIDPWADYSPDSDTELTAHGSSVSEHNVEDAVQPFSFQTEQYVRASEVQAPCHLDSKNPTEILLEAIEVVNASGGSVAPASSDIFSGPTA
ncbi:PHD-finger [Opisthorchis viverrini]|uniref:PHD-finger n=1 Tax=Opisthorchis viverrini TaxID=6198 RepID=A0A1S8XAA3_OPIVI|nr:PHD-finger [Opisthorchis viverrini]